jgi:hypothetical protein
MSKLILDENFSDIEASVELNESTGSKKYRIKGLFSTPDEKNRNGRIYSKKLWEGALSEWKARSKEDPKFTLMEAEHPNYVAPNIWKAVAKITKLDFKSDGRIYGEAEILDTGTEKVNQIKALIDAGIKIGVSSRGVGSMKGNIVEKYQLQTYDIVANPSNFGAELEGFNESFISEKNYIMNESNEWICDENGCSIDPESTCHQKATVLIEALKEFTKEPVQMSENEKTVRELMAKDVNERKKPQTQYEIEKEIDKLEKAAESGDEKDIKALKDYKDYVKNTGRTE